ncbi:MAG: protein kinase [Ignavibacteria bacterium]|nr:protein kinase [Ignavibacteria bacterium]
MTDTRIGHTIQGFRILEKIGEGGMGVVYKARDTALNRNVALKFLQGHLSVDAASKERFMTEARAASALDHPNICTIHSVGETDDGDLFITMTLYEGETLRARIARGPLSVDDALHVFSQAAAALAAAHAVGIIHRDIKPENISLAADGTVKILDFGLARIGAGTMTAEQTSAGTLAYMSPEQLRSEEIDGRVDVWALGVLLFEMLAGHLPFKGYIPATVIYSVLNEDPEDIGSVRGDVPAHVRALIAACLDRERGTRPDAARLVAMLKADGGAEAGLGARDRSSRPPRSRWLFPVSALGVLALCAVAWLLFRPSSAADDADDRLRIGILPFANLTGMKDLDGYSELIPELLVNEMTGRGEIAPLDPMSFHTNMTNAFDGAPVDPQDRRFTALLTRSRVDYVLAGSFAKSPGGFVIASRLLNPKGDVAFSSLSSFAAQGELGAAVGSLFRQVGNYLRITDQVLRDSSLRPWMGRGTQNLDARLLFLRARHAIYKGESAMEDLRATVALDSTFVAARVWLISGLRWNDTTEAWRHYRILHRQRIDASPFDLVLIDYIGAVLRADERMQVAHLKEALRLSPNNFILLVNLEELLFENGDYEDAYRTLQPALAAEWEYAPVYPAAASCLLRLGRIDEAAALIDASFTREHVCAASYQVRAAIGWKRGDTARAEADEARYIQEYLKISQSRAAAYRGLANGFLATGDFLRAADCAQKAVDIDTESTRARLLLARALVALRRDADAKRAVDRVLAREPGNPAALYLLGRVLELQGNMRGAADAFRAYVAKESATFNAIKLLQRFPTLREAS